MKILFGIQATGNGHLQRSAWLINALRNEAEVDILLSGNDCELNTGLDVKYRLNGLGFVFGNNGGISVMKTWNQWNLRQLYRDYKQLEIEKYDAVISDFEPISLFKAGSTGKPSIGISNQYAYFLPEFRRPSVFAPLGNTILRHYAPAKTKLAYFYEPFAENVYSPWIPPAIRNGMVSDDGFILVYLPAYHHRQIEAVTSLFPFHRWKVFGKRIQKAYVTHNAEFLPVNAQHFSQALLACSGLVCAAGFGTTSEALFLGKKMLVVPMKGQVEQQYNAHWLQERGVQVISAFHADLARQIMYWIQNDEHIQLTMQQDGYRLLSDILRSIHNEYRSDKFFPQQLSAGGI